MNVFFDIASSVFVISFAFALGFFVKWLFLFSKNRSLKNDSLARSGRHCMEACCVFCSLSVASVAFILIGTPWQSIMRDFSFESYFFYTVIFLSSFAFVAFFRVLAPIIISIYVLYCFVFAFLLIQSYAALPERFSVSVPQGSIVEFQTVTLSYKNLLPLPRQWVSDPIVIDLDSSVEESNMTIFRKSIDAFGKDSFVANIIIMLSSLILDQDIGVEIIRIDEFIDQNDTKSVEFSVFVENSTIVVDSL